MTPEREETDAVLDRLYRTVVARRAARPDESYVAKLFAGGWQAIAGKVREDDSGAEFPL